MSIFFDLFFDESFEFSTFTESDETSHLSDTVPLNDKEPPFFT